MEHWDADCDVSRHYVARAVKSSWLVTRGEDAGDAMVIKNMIALADAAADREAEEVERLTREPLSENPASIIRQLRKTIAGCLWIRGQLLILLKPIKQDRRLLPSQRTLAINLLGKQVHDVFRHDPVVTRWVIALLGTQESPGRGTPRGVSEALGGPPAGISIDEYSFQIDRLIAALVSPAESTDRLRKYIKKALAELDARMARLAEVAEDRRALDETVARMDANTNATVRYA